MGSKQKLHRCTKNCDTCRYDVWCNKLREHHRRKRVPAKHEVDKDY